MIRRAVLVLSLALAITAAAGCLTGGRNPATDDPHHAEGDREGCARCHLGQVPPTHTQDFLTDQHGEASRAERASCLGCHDRQECDDCHEQKRPLWHESGVAWPQLSAQNRRTHATHGKQRRLDCLACHAHRFQEQCAECHQRAEFPQ